MDTKSNNPLFSVVYIESGSRHTYTPQMVADILNHFEAVHLGCYPCSDPEINGHLILVPFKNLHNCCRRMSEYGQDAGHRVDSNGVAYLTDNAGRSWYRTQSCRGKDENSPYAGPLNYLGVLNKVSNHLGMLERPSEPEKPRTPPQCV